MSKGHFVPSIGTMLDLELSLAKKGIDIFELSYSSFEFIFFGKGFKEKWAYNNITIFHLRY